MTVSIILESRDHDTITGTPGMSVFDVVKLFAAKRIGAVPIVDGTEVVGIMSERDLVHCVAAEGSAGLEKPVSEVMTSPAITVDPNFSILAALGLMTRRRIRHLPVIDNGVLVGFISIGDLVKYRMDRIEQDAQAMRDYIQSV
ncbi:MAG: CBS domain-containing protein [Parasphingopyxis sp.]